MTIQDAINLEEIRLKQAKSFLQREIIDLTDRIHDMTAEEYIKELNKTLRYYGSFPGTIEKTIEELKKQ